MKKIVSIILAAALALSVFAGCSGKSDKDKSKLKILTTIAPQYDWLKNLTDGAKDVELNMLLDTGADLHSFQPSTDDIYQISSCDVFVYTGGNSDKWVDNALKNNEKVLAINLMELLGDKAKEEETVEGMQAEEEEEEEGGKEYDEHIWLSLKNADYICEKITEKLSEKDSKNKDVYEKNQKSYSEKLKKLDGEYENSVRNAQNNTLIFADRFPFRYMTDDYKLKYYAAFVGCSAETEASFKTVKFLADKLTELKLPALMTIDGSDQKIAKTMQSMKHDDIEKGNDYIKVMKDNLEVLKKALN